MLMGSPHLLGVSTGPDESYLVLFKKICKNQNNKAFNPGPAQPPGGEGSPLFVSVWASLTF